MMDINSACSAQKKHFCLSGQQLRKAVHVVMHNSCAPAEFISQLWLVLWLRAQLLYLTH
jgi:hypothetical protein